MKNKKIWILWFALFSVIFILSMDFWSWNDEITFNLFHLPSWVFYLMFLQILLAAGILIFSIKHWD